MNSLTNRKPVKVNENSYLFGVDEEDMKNLNTYQEKVYSHNTNRNLEPNEYSPYDSKNKNPRKFLVHISQVIFKINKRINFSSIYLHKIKTNPKTKKKTIPNEKENLIETQKEPDLSDVKKFNIKIQF